VRIKTKLLELLAPVRVWITEALDIDAAWQAAFDSCFHKWRRRKRKRERQINLAHCASFALCQLLGVGD
jgi:hypothetical protein